MNEPATATKTAVGIKLCVVNWYGEHHEEAIVYSDLTVEDLERVPGVNRACHKCGDAIVIEVSGRYARADIEEVIHKLAAAAAWGAA